jgi:spermidine/putrescine transport system ATP-binding protein
MLSSTKQNERGIRMKEKIKEKLILKIEHLSKYFGKICAVDNISLEVQRGEFLILLGPSGCGKTTTLRLVAGLEDPTSGQIYCEGLFLNPLPPYKRPVNTVFQNYALFPHMSVFENVGYSLRVKRVPRGEIKKRVGEALRLVALGGFQPRYPRELSGGQQQRVALARSLICQPSILLLDEPLGALDLKLRKEMQIALKSLQAKVGITFIHVTHDQEEAMTMADRIVVMNEGKIVQIGTPKDLYYNPVNRFVADFIGETNMIEGEIVEVIDREVKLKSRNKIIISAKPSHIDSGELEIGRKVSVSVRPEKISIHDRSLDLPNVFSGTVIGFYFLGIEQKIMVETEDKSEIMVRVREMKDSRVFHRGEKVKIGWEKEDGSIFF